MIYFKIIFFTQFLLISNNLLSVQSNYINVGLISEGDNNDINLIFTKAIEAASKRSGNMFGSYTANISYGNVFESSKELCKILAKGIGGVFSLTARNSAMHMMNICDEKEIPFIDIRLDSEIKNSAINLHPHPKYIAQILHDIIDSYSWTSFTLLYESSQYLGILNELMDLYVNEGPTITVRKYELQLNRNYRSVLRRVRKSKDNSIVIIGSIETLSDLLKQAQQVGIITEEYQYLISNFDFHTLDLEQYKYSEANITGFRMISPENEDVKSLIKILGYPDESADRNISCPITLDMALLYDGVQLYADSVKVINHMPLPLDCSKDNHWTSGYTLNNYISLSSTNGLTGNIHFDHHIRADFSLELIGLTTSGIKKIGEWNTKREIVLDDYSPVPLLAVGRESPIKHTLVNKTFIVLTAMSKPYGMIKISTLQLSGNDRFEGYGIELIQRLAEKLGFNYTFNMHSDDNYGAFNITSNTSSGMIREVIEYRADLAITDLTITSERQEGVDFTIPFMNLGISILYKKPQKEPPKLFSFMDPFSRSVWMYLGLAYFGVSMSFFILGRLSPAEWDNPYPCIEHPTELENQFSIGNSLWFTTGALLQQGSEVAPKAPSTRTVASIWWFFTLIMVSSYTANLAAFLTVESLFSPIDNVHDLAENKGGVKYGAKKSGSTRNFFLNSNETEGDAIGVNIYSKMNEYMKKNPDLLTDTNELGVERVQKENYAFLMESTSIEYNVARKCNLKQIGSLLDEKGYGIAMRKNWPYRDEFNHALLELQEAGVLTKMKAKWWYEVGTGGCNSKTDQSSASGLGMPNLGGVYFVLLVGSILAGAFGIFQWIFTVYRRSLNFNAPFKQEFGDEIKFVSNCSNSTRPVRRIAQNFTRNSSVNSFS